MTPVVTCYPELSNMMFVRRDLAVQNLQFSNSMASINLKKILQNVIIKLDLRVAKKVGRKPDPPGNGNVRIPEGRSGLELTDTLLVELCCASVDFNWFSTPVAHTIK